MSPDKFKVRFISSLPEVPPDLDFTIDDFVLFPAHIVERLQISTSDKAILSISDLPVAAAPFLTFGLFDDTHPVQPLASTIFLRDSFSRYRPIGSNGCGDMICIDEASDGAIVCLNHDADMMPVFMNSSVTTLAESLCLFAELMTNKDAGKCRHGMREVDPAAVASDTFWSNEIARVEQDQ